jgi:hypothetical protein
VLQESNKGKEQNKPLKMTLIYVDINLHGKPPFQEKNQTQSNAESRLDNPICQFFALSVVYQFWQRYTHNHHIIILSLKKTQKKKPAPNFSGAGF